eukprot:COSAG01_NODE_1099_length_11701_cov_8.251508_4_plen_192_part_00
MTVSTPRRLSRLCSRRYSITAHGWSVARSIRCSSSSTKACCLWLETGDFFVRTGAASNTQCAPIVVSCVESVRLLQPSPAAYSCLPARTVFPSGNKVLHCLHTERPNDTIGFDCGSVPAGSRRLSPAGRWVWRRYRQGRRASPSPGAAGAPAHARRLRLQPRAWVHADAVAQARSYTGDAVYDGRSVPLRT